MQMFFQIENNF